MIKAFSEIFLVCFLVQDRGVQEGTSVKKEPVSGRNQCQESIRIKKWVPNDVVRYCRSHFSLRKHNPMATLILATGIRQTDRVALFGE